MSSPRQVTPEAGGDRSAVARESLWPYALAKGDRRHGTSNGYSNLKCRCLECREARRIYVLEWRWRTGYNEPLDSWLDQCALRSDLAPHGTNSKYKRGCRCDECRAGEAARRRQHRWANIEATRAYDRARRRGAA